MHQDIAAVRGMCAEIYHTEGVDLWMTAPNKTLGGRSPWELIRDGETDRVLQVLEQLITGAYS
jgi:hypothetical protein